MAKKKFVKSAKLPQAASAEEIEARDKLEASKQAARAGRRAAAGVDDDDNKKKKSGGDSDDSGSDDGSDDMFEDDGPEEQGDGEEEEKAHKPKSLLDQLGIELEGAVNINAAAKIDNKAVSAKKMVMDASAGKPEMSRKEREAMETQQKAAAYARKHAAGETDEAKTDLARLAEVRKRREEAAAKKLQAETDAAAQEAAAEAKKEADKKAANTKVELVIPTQKEMKSALLKLQEVASADYQARHQLKGASGNKLAKIKYAEFTKMWEDFCASESPKIQKEFAA